MSIDFHPAIAMRGTDNAALASVLEDAMQKATTPAYNQDTDSLEALRELLEAIGDELETRLSAARAGNLDELDFDLQATLVAIAAAERGTDNALLAANYTAPDNAGIATLLTRVTAAVALASSLVTHHTALGTHDTDIKSLLATIAGYIDTEVATIITTLDTPANFMADLTTLESRLSAVRAGYLDQLDFALQEAIAAIPTTAMRGTDGAALASAWTAALATVLGNYTAVRAGNLDNLSAGAAALEATLTAIKGGGWSTQTLVAIKDAVDAITGAVSTDWKGSFNWDTSEYTTVEQDISALFSTNLALATRRKYSVKLDLTAVEADASFVSLYLAVKEKIDGTNYRAIDRKTILKDDIAAAAESGIIIDIPATSENIQITMQMFTSLAEDATIYYAVVKEHLE